MCTGASRRGWLCPGRDCRGRPSPPRPNTRPPPWHQQGVHAAVGGTAAHGHGRGRGGSGSYGEVGEGFVGDEGQVLGQVYLGQRELRGRGLQPGQRVAGPPALRRPGGGVEAGPRVPRLRVHLGGGERGQRRPAARRASLHPVLHGARAQQQLAHGRQVVTLVLRHARPHRRRALEV